MKQPQDVSRGDLDPLMMEDPPSPTRDGSLKQRRLSVPRIPKHSPGPNKTDNFWRNYEQNLGTVKEEEVKESNQQPVNLEGSLAESGLPSSLAENPDEGDDAARERGKRWDHRGISPPPASNLHQNEPKHEDEEVIGDKLHLENQRAKSNEAEGEEYESFAVPQSEPKSQRS